MEKPKNGMHRLLSRKDRKSKEVIKGTAPLPDSVTSPAMSLPLTTSNTSSSASSLHTPSGHFLLMSSSHRKPESSASSFTSSSSFSLAFPVPRTKASPRILAVDGTVTSSTTNSSDSCLLQPRLTAGHLHGLFTEYEESAPEKDEETKVGMPSPLLRFGIHTKPTKIKALSKRLGKTGLGHFKNADIQYALNAPYASGDTEKAYEVLVLLEESEEGIVKEYDPNIHMLGAVNRNNVSCYLDATLFAMFARLDSFEGILYNTFEDEPRKKLAALMRLWVNTLRTKQLQEAIAACGWEAAMDGGQQDASEAFAFITETLQLPMLTLKMDIFHTGKEEVDSDHKFVRERLLAVAIPDDKPEGEVLTLEDCLTTYFESRIEVRRYLDRRLTATTGRPRISIDTSKGYSVQVESKELGDSSPSTSAPSLSPLPMYSPVRSSSSLPHRPSLIHETWVPNGEEAHGIPSLTDNPTISGGRTRSGTTGSMRTEVMMPAWQFFSLIPWYTDTIPNSDAQVAAHFSSKRPILGICLKRYGMDTEGRALRKGVHVDIPLEIGLPRFVHDDTMADSGAALGNFKLVLQSVVCHRGQRVDSGHYVSLIRGLASNQAKRDKAPDSKAEESWILFDDLSQERVRPVDVRRTLDLETPYLLFYQVIPIEEGGGVDDGRHPSGTLLPDMNPPEYSAREYADSIPSYTSGPEAGAVLLNGRRASEAPTDSSESTVQASRPRISFEEPSSLKENGLEPPAAVPRPRGRNPSKTKENRLSTSLNRMMATTAFTDAGEKARLKKEKAKAKGKSGKECAIM